MEDANTISASQTNKIIFDYSIPSHPKTPCSEHQTYAAQTIPPSLTKTRVFRVPDSPPDTPPETPTRAELTGEIPVSPIPQQRMHITSSMCSPAFHSRTTQSRSLSLDLSLNSMLAGVAAGIFLTIWIVSNEWIGLV